MFDLAKAFWTAGRKDERGVTAVEYAVIAGVLVTAIAGAFTALGTTLTTFFTGLAL
jgi:Flp pilus assembly pilin Flp